MAALRRLRVSKYNSGPFLTEAELGLGPRPAGGRVLVVDQTYGDSSIEYGLAKSTSFQDMLDAALAENPDAEIVVKTHPEVISGAKCGYLGSVIHPRVRIFALPVNPWSLIEAVDKVYVVTSQLGFEAMMAGRAVTCFGAPFYAGWGLTDDRVSIPRRTARPSLEQLFAAIYFRYSRYLDPYTRRETTFEKTVEQLAYLRDRFLENNQPSIAVRISRWKRAIIDRLLDGFGGAPVHAWTIAGAVRMAKSRGGRIVTWASKCTRKLEAACAEGGVPLVRVEDGFVRSVGLGAAYVQGASYSLDTSGMHHDARQPSDLERLLQTADVSRELLLRAGELRQSIVRHGLSKYNLAAGDVSWEAAKSRRRILVPGQVETDASVKAARALGFETGRFEGVNLALLRAVRARNPAAFIVYKTHPDVAANLRRGHVSKRTASRYADQVIDQGSIVSLIRDCDHVETLSSLTGFEALLRGKTVTAHGLPFYAGWGLTEDLMTCSRRQRRRSLDELVAISLILYPRYVHPEALLPCEPEVIVSYLAEQLQSDAGTPVVDGMVHNSIQTA
ncbi:MAG: capsular polysaccharide biosynthesis protein [Hyphomicrobium sp.]